MEFEKKVKALLIIEVLGKPPEHVLQALKDLVERMGKEKDVEIISKKFNEPKPAQTLFVTFAEVEIAVPDLFKLFEICFSYMPASVEIFEPADLKFAISDANLIINGLMSRLHQYDAVAKRLSFENMILKNQLQQIKGMQAPQNIIEANPEKPAEKSSKNKKQKKTKKKGKK
jgi:hypothetical protein